MSAATFQPISMFQPVVVSKYTDLSQESRYHIVPTPLDNIPEDSPVEYQPEKRPAGSGTVVIVEGSLNSDSSEDQAAAWARLFQVIHKQKSRVFVQLSCPGHVAEGDMSEAEISGRVEEYRCAATLAVAAGADGVEIHGASGSLPSEFLDSRLNKRSDQYGGSVQNRARFILQIVDAVVPAVGANRVSVHLAPYGLLGSMSATERTSIIAQYSYLVGQLERRAVLGNRLVYIRLEEPGRSALCFHYNGDTISFVYSIWRGAVIQRDHAAPHVKKVQNFV